MTSQQSAQYILGEISRIYSEGIPSIHKILDDEKKVVDFVTDLEVSITGLNYSLANSVGENTHEEQGYGDQGIHGVIGLLKEINSIGENIKESLKNSIPVQNTGDSNIEDGEKPIELEIEYIEPEKYRLNVNNYQNEKIEDVEINILYKDYTIPVHSIKLIKAYSKNTYTVKIPLNLFFYQGSVSVSIDTNQKNLISKQFFAIDILEIIRKGEVLQFKVRNNTGLAFKGCLYDRISQNYIDITVDPGKIELFEQQISSGEFSVFRDVITFSDIHKFD